VEQATLPKGLQDSFSSLYILTSFSIKRVNKRQKSCSKTYPN
jgi:hypothetical protein